MTTKITTDNIAPSTLTSLGGPKISEIVYPGTETATNPAGGQTITITGTGFNAGFSIIIGSTSASVTTYVSSTEVTFTAPAASSGTYVLYLINTDGGTAISIPGLSYSGVPNWSTAAGSLGTSYETTSINTTVVATGDVPITYSLYSGTLPTGSTLSSGGLLSGTAPSAASATTYSFTIEAKDAENQTTNRAFSLTINPDVVTWSSPADNTTYNVFTETEIANVTMSATSAGSGSITYTANALPTGLSISGANIAGTPTVAANSSTLLTATSSINSRAATRTINWVVSVANDTYFKNVTLLLNGETTVTPFISDASTNSLALTIAGDTKPVLFNPYTPGYYSNYFDGTGDYLTLPNSASFAFGTGDFTIEFWINTTDTAGGLVGQETSGGWGLNIYSNTIYWASAWGSTNLWNYSAATITNGAWHHLAFSRVSGSTKFFIDGVLVATNTDGTNYTATTGNIQIGRDANPADLVGYISNLHIVKGTAVYTSAFTPPTTPLTAISGTSLLTCQSNRFIDNSTNNFTITKAGDTTISPNIPFTQNSTYGSTYFDGTGDYLTIPDNTALQFGSGNWTVEFWVYLSTIGSYRGFFSKCTNDSYINGVCAGTDASGNLWITATNSGSAPWTLPGSILYASVFTTNRWYHVAIVRNSNTITGYVNGVAGGTPQTLSGTVYDSGQVFNIGSSNGSSAGQKMDGYINDFRFVKGTAVYTTAFTPPTAPLTAIANTSLLTLQYNGGATNQAIIDNSNFNNIITRNGNTNQGTFSPYSVTGWSNFVNSAYIATASSSQFIASGNGFTIEAWVYYTVVPSYTFIVATTTGAGGYNPYWFIGSTPSLTWRLSWGDYASVDTGVTFSLNTWYHVAMSMSSAGSGTFYVNGVSRATATGKTLNGSATGIVIGDGGGLISGSYPLGAYISNVRYVNNSSVYTGAFTPSTSPLTSIAGTQLLTCQSNRFIDNSPNNFALTLTSTSVPLSVQAFDPFGSISEATPISYSTYFNGSSDYLTVATSLADPTSDFTIELWWYPTVLAGSTYYGIFVKGNGIQIYYYNGLTIALSANNTTSYFVQGTAGTPTLNVWNHIALVRNGNAYTVYLNGTGTSLASSASSPNTGSGTITIGAYSAIYYSSGYMSNVRYVVGTAVYTANFTPSTTPLTAITNTKLLTCQSSTMIDNSTNNFAIGVQGSPKVYKFNPFGYTAQSATSYTPSLHGGSIYLDGTGDYLRYNNTSIMTFSGSSNFTVECWVYQTAYTSTSGYMNNIIGDLTPTDATALYWSVGMNASNQPGLRWYDGTVKTADSGTALPLNTWNHVAWVVTSGVVTIFVNGIKATLTGTTTLTTPSSIGYYITGADRGTYFTGYMSDLRITKSALYTSNFVPPTQTIGNYSTSYPAQLLLNFNNGGIIDQHGTNVLETLGNAQLSTSVKKYGNASIYFDGTGDYLSIPNNTLWALGTGDFTIEFWVYFNAFPSATWMVQLSQYVDTNNRVSIFFGNNATNENGLVFKVVTSSTVYKAVENDSASITMASLGYSTSTWYHVAITRSGSTIKGFINGTQKCTTTTSATFPTLAAPLLIGSFDTTPQLTHNGYIDDLRITKGVARYTSNFTAPTSALITK